jgi:ParB family chromosome partitioning protein
MARKALGRGISALLGEGESYSDPGWYELNVSLIDPNPEQTRETFSKEKLDELARSIEVHGFVQPIIVRKQGSRFQIIAGERRWRAAQLLGLTKIPVLVRPIADEKIMEAALIENVQRENLNPLEEAKAYDRLANEFGLTQEEVAKRTGKDRSTVSNLLRLLNLSSFVQNLVREQRLSMGHARALLALPDPDSQEELASRTIKQGLSVRQVEHIINAQKNKSFKESKGKLPQDPNISAATERLESVLGTKVRIVTRKGNSGRIEIDFYSQAELQRLYDYFLK